MYHEKIPPQNIEAEDSVIGSILVSEDAIYEVIGKLQSQDFYSLKNRIVYEAIIELFEKGELIDLLTVSAHLESHKKDSVSVSRSDLVSYTISVATGSHIANYAKIVKDKSLRRQLLKAQSDNESDIYDESVDVNKVIAHTQERLFAVNPLKQKSDDIHTIMQDLESVQVTYAEKYQEGNNIIGYSTGMKRLDNSNDGVQRGHFWVIGGWHGTGKTSFALNIVNSLLEQDVGVGIISLEMGQVQLVSKIMGIRALTSSMKILKGKYDDEMSEKILHAKKFLSDKTIEIHIQHDIDRIKMQIRKDFYTKGIHVFLVDYIQKIQHEKIYNETELMSKVSIELANLCQELNVCIILLSQISNEAQKGGGAGAGYKGSGTIEASADMAIRLKRDKKNEEPDAEWVPLQIHITKNKYGFDGVIGGQFHLQSGKFVEEPK